jgi:hypothetical protein
MRNKYRYISYPVSHGWKININRGRLEDHLLSFKKSRGSLSKSVLQSSDSLGPRLLLRRSLLTFIPVSALYLMMLLLPVILALMVVASSAHKFTATGRKLIHNRASSLSNRQTPVNITHNAQDGVNIRCVVSLLLSSCALSRNQVLCTI